MARGYVHLKKVGIYYKYSFGYELQLLFLNIVSDGFCNFSFSEI
jgi:hypothetical protein